MRNQVHRFGAIKPRSPHKPRIRKILTNAAGALTMLLGIIALGVAWADALTISTRVAPSISISATASAALTTFMRA